VAYIGVSRPVAPERRSGAHGPRGVTFTPWPFVIQTESPLPLSPSQVRQPLTLSDVGAPAALALGAPVRKYIGLMSELEVDCLVLWLTTPTPQPESVLFYLNDKRVVMQPGEWLERETDSRSTTDTASEL
jgi:hypothetical protein